MGRISSEDAAADPALRLDGAADGPAWSEGKDASLDADPAEREQHPASRARRFADAALGAFSNALLVIAVCFAVAVVVLTLTAKGDASGFVGWKPYVVLSDSMQKDFQVGDVVVTRAVDPADVRPGDIISFESIDPDADGKVFTHKVRKVITYEGERAFTTYGTTTGVDDAYPALASHVRGRLAFSIPKAGYAFQFFKSPYGYVALVLVPFTLIIGLQVLHIVRLVQGMREADAAEARAAIAEQEAALAAERARADAMEAELARLRADGPRAGGDAGSDDGVEAEDEGVRPRGSTDDAEQPDGGAGRPDDAGDAGAEARGEHSG